MTAMRNLIFALAICTAFTSCKKDSNPAVPIDEVQPIEEMDIPMDFSYSTFNSVIFRIGVESSNGSAIPGARIQVFLGGYADNGQSTAFLNGFTGDNGNYTMEAVIPADVSEVNIIASLIGALNSVSLSTSNGQVQHTFRIVRGNGGRIGGKGSKIPQIDLVHFLDPVVTGSSMSIIIQGFDGIEVVDGAEIACLTPADLIAGLAYVELDSATGQMGLAVWENDYTTEDVDGFISGEPLAFIYWDPASQMELDATITQHIGDDVVFIGNGFAAMRLQIETPQSRIRFIGGWTENGVPDYLDENNEDYSIDFLRKIAITLPENADLSPTYDEFIVESGDIQLSGDAELSLSFLHEGTAQQHTLGFYAYQTNNPPQSVDDIEYFTIVFPNLSFVDNEAGLSVGNRVQLGEFSAGTSLGWFVFVDGWTGSSINQDAKTIYSNADFNPGGELNRQSIYFYDSVNDRVVLGFEDHECSGESDSDFNDVLFTVNASPADAFYFDGVAEWDQGDPPPDADEDGISDAVDAFPNDESVGFANIFPTPLSQGTIAFENNWPEVGDYDFNDLVITYVFNLQTNSDGMVVKLLADFDIKAIGTESRDGFGFILPLDPGQVRQVEGSVLDAGYLNMTGSNLEAGHDEAVVIVIDDALSWARPAGGYNYVNTEAGSPEVTSETIQLVIELDEPIPFDELGSPPYNPFLIVDGNRDYEVHSADMPGSDLMNNELYGQGRDDSDPNTDRYYKSDVNLPWALVMSGEWRHPIEGTPINAAYTNFAGWAESGGGAGRGWFLPFGGNVAEGMVWRGE
jgi:LruC domain-containing protein